MNVHAILIRKLCDGARPHGDGSGWPRGKGLAAAIGCHGHNGTGGWIASRRALALANRIRHGRCNACTRYLRLLLRVTWMVGTSCVGFGRANRIQAKRDKLLLRTQPAAGFGLVHILSPLTLLSTTSLWHPIIEGFLSLHLPLLSHLALFLSLFPVSLLSFPPFHIQHLDFTIPIFS